MLDAGRGAGRSFLCLFSIEREIGVSDVVSANRTFMFHPLRPAPFPPEQNARDAGGGI